MDVMTVLDTIRQLEATRATVRKMADDIAPHSTADNIAWLESLKVRSLSDDLDYQIGRLLQKLNESAEAKEIRRQLRLPALKPIGGEAAKQN